MSLALRLAALLLVIVLTERHAPTGGGGGTGACTVGPFFAATTNMAGLQTAINGLGDGETACIARGETFASSTGITLTKSHPAGNRATVCASSGSGASAACTDTGAPDPVIQVTATADGLTFATNSGGLEFRHVHVDNTVTNTGSGSTNATSITNGTHDVRFVGSSFTGWYHQFWAVTAVTTPPTNFEFGVCGAPLEIANDSTSNAQFQQASFGSFKNSAFRLNVHDYVGHGTGSNISHFLDFIYNAAVNWQDDTRNSTDITIECGTYGPNISGGEGWLILDAGRRAVIRDNVVTAFCNHWISPGSHGPDSNSYGWDDIQVYRNVFDCPNGGELVSNTTASNVKMFDNLVRLSRTGNSNAGLYATVGKSAGANVNISDNDPDHVAIFNNTVLMYGNEPNDTGFQQVHGSNSDFQGGAGPAGNDYSMINNVTLDSDANNPAGAWGLQGPLHCNNYGTNAVQAHHNFEYSAGSGGSGGFNGFLNAISTCSGDDNWILSGSNPAATGDGWSVKPGLNGDSGNWLAAALSSDFTPISNASRVCGVGDTTTDALRSQKDYFGNTCPTHDIGAICCPP